MNTKTLIHRIIAVVLIGMMLVAVLPVAPARALSLNIASVASGTWEATAWPSTLRSGTITVTSGNTTVSGTGTAFLTELSVGNIIRTTGNVMIGTVAAITSDTSLTLVNVPATSRAEIAYRVQGVGPADNVTIANTHTVTVAAKPINQSGTVTVNPGGTLTVSEAGAVFSTLSVDGVVNATTGNAFGALTVNNGGVVNAGTAGAYTAASLTINSGGTLNISRPLTVNGATLISGTINFSSNSITSRAMQFAGPVTLNSGAAWVEPASGNGANNTYAFQDNLTNNATTFTTSSASTHTFSGAGKTLNGSTTTSIARVVISGTYTNDGILTVGTNLSGTGSLTNSGTGTLNIGGTSSISTLANAGTATKSGPGPITTALANFTNTGTLNLMGTGTIAGITNNAAGIVNLVSSGSITAFNNATATSTLNILMLSVPHFHTLTVSAPGNTVNYGGAGAQTVKHITYSNLVFSGSGTKSITMPSGSTLANGNLSIAPTGTATASVIGPNLSVNHLTLAGAGKTSGTWGSTSSAAANQDNTFFALTSGYLNVTNDTRQSQSISFTSAAPVDAAVGGATYTPIAVATSGLSVDFTIDASASSVCSISTGQVSFIANGTCVINATQAGDSSYLATVQQQSFDVKTSQTISFTSTAPANAAVDGSTYTPSATATSGLAVDFTIDASASAVCSISAGVVSFDANGICVINANQSGDSSYHPAPQAQQSFTVSKGTQTINFTSTAPNNAIVGGAYMPSATATSDLPVDLTIDPSASAVCSISASVVSFTAVGTCVINANQAGDANYQAAPQVQQAFTVSKGLQSISFTSTAPSKAIVGGPTYTPAASATSGLPVELTIDPSASSICSISAGVVSFTANGTCLINANQAGGANYLAAPQVQQSITVSDTPTFFDVDSDYWAWIFIERLYGAGITGGCGTSPLRYCPEQTVTRAQMAVFLERGINGSAFMPPAVGNNTGFVDVATDYWAAAFIKQLVMDGITAGCGNGNYCPDQPVTRAQMAVFLLRAEHGASYTPPAVGNSTGFADVPTDHWAAAFIKQLVAEGLTAGCGNGNYCPEQPVNRAQMAVFLVRTFNLP